MIKINTSMISTCSRGVKRFHNEVAKNLSVEFKTCHWLEDIFKGFFSVSQRNVKLWSPGQGGSLLSNRHIVTCHDVIDFSFYGKGGKLKLKKAIHNYIYQKASAIIFISESTRNDFERIFPQVTTRKIVIQSATNLKISYNYDCTTFSRYSLTGHKYFILITNAMPHKNNRIFIDAINHLNNDDVRGVILGEVSDQDAELVNNNSRFINLKSVSDDELFTLIKGAQALISTSHIEGHNLTIAEAMSIGTNVIASDIDVHREFYSDSCVLFNRYNSKQLSELMQKTICNEQLFPTVDLKSRRTWYDVARDYESFFDDLN